MASLKFPADLDREVRDQRRARLAPGYAVGVTEEMIHAQVHSFYARVREDAELGAIFNRRIADWDAHLAKLCDFWSSVLLMTGRFHGAPMRAHLQVAEINAPLFERWLGLWADTAQKVCPPEAALLFTARARTIASSLQLGIAASRGEAV
ncbi:group III truncated hemoglobin [Phenylobacterium sp.]|jgi:hemoglobin|uniref:group III truncated hemoglobin n=1 Tax=Phenylobacterium sp. TaxID=1871053 RepID=UPI002F949FF5